MNLVPSPEQQALAEAGLRLGRECRSLSPANAAEYWRRAGVPEILRRSNRVGAALFLDAYARERGSLRAVRQHAEAAIATAPAALEGALLAGGLVGLTREVIENVRLPEGKRPAGFPTEKDPHVRRALADASAWATIAQTLALRAAWAADRFDGGLAGSGAPDDAGASDAPASREEVAQAAAMALSAACDAVLSSWAALSRLLIGEEIYAAFETDLFRAATKAKPGAQDAIAESVIGGIS